MIVALPQLLDLLRERAVDISKGAILGAINDRSEVIRGEGLWAASMLDYPLLYASYLLSSFSKIFLILDYLL